MVDQKEGQGSTGLSGFLKKIPVWLGLRFNEGIRWYHGLAFYFAVLFGITVFVYASSVQSFLLKTVLGVPSSDLGNTSGDLQVADETVSIFALGIWGIVSDKIGRRWVYTGGFLISALALCLMPISRSVYPEYLLYRLIFAVGTGAIGSMVTAVLSDYAHPLARGRVAGFVGLAAGLGALLGVFGFLPIAKGSDGSASSIKLSYWIVGGISAGVSLLLFFSLPRQHQGQQKMISERGKWWFFKLAKEGLVACKEPRVVLAYCAGFVARGSSIVNSVFIPVWVLKYYEEQDLCQPTGEDGTECSSAISRTAALTGVVNVLALIGAPLFGFLTDRIGPQLETNRSTVWEEVESTASGSDTGKSSRTMSNSSGTENMEGSANDRTLSAAALMSNDDRRPSYGTHDSLPTVNATADSESKKESDHKEDSGEATNPKPSVDGTVSEAGLVQKYRRMERDRSWGVFIAALVGFIGFGSAYFLHDLNSGLAFGVCALFGLSQIGMVVTSSALVAQVSPKDARGSIAGMFSLLGGLGILVCSKVGGTLADSWTPAAPFLILALLHALVVAVGLPVGIATLVRLRKERREAHSA